MKRSGVENFCNWVSLIQSEYAEMPGLQLSKPQAQRLWNLDSRTADIIFDALESSRFLTRTTNNTYKRADMVVG
jgi:hypothetical protein